MPSNMVANTNHTTLLKNQSAIKYLPQMCSLSNFVCKIIFMCSVNFWHQQDSNSLFKGSISHVTSQCKWPIDARIVQTNECDNVNSLPASAASIQCNREPENENNNFFINYLQFTDVFTKQRGYQKHCKIIVTSE